jgi:predicted transcriptional regulator
MRCSEKKKGWFQETTLINADAAVIGPSMRRAYGLRFGLGADFPSVPR